MPTDLDILKKAFLNVTASYDAAKPGDEPLSRRGTVLPEQVTPAPVQGGVGGWMASGGFPYASVLLPSGAPDFMQEGSVPPSRRYFETEPGRAGYSDLDFVPYNWGTNRFGGKGGALLGHAISWEVIGPTGKSPFVHWQWDVVDDYHIDLEAGAMSATFLGPGTLPTVAEAYGLTGGTINGGMYVLVTLTGKEAFNLLMPGDAPLVPLNGATYRHELFRVAGTAGQRITLETGKPLSSYFTLPGAPQKIKAITLIAPKVTRLAAFPLSLNGTTQRNQVFVFLPPERAANSEYMPPYIGGTAGSICPDWFSVGGFDVSGTCPAADPLAYGTPSALPVPLPKQSILKATFQNPPGANRGNQWMLVGNLTEDLLAGQVVRVRGLEAQALISSPTEAAKVFGWYEATSTVFAGAGVTIYLNRVPEVNSATGEVFYGNGPWSGGGSPDALEMEVYDNISSIFTDPVLGINKVVASRLDHLIDPKGIEGSYKGLYDLVPLHTNTPSGPAIFNTVFGSDPGNLTDLGFRVVLYPAKDDGFGNPIADFNSPITNTRVVLDPTLPATTEQTIEIDYAGGVLYLSHPPRPGAGCTVAPNGIIGGPGTTNPRNEVVLFASCVAHSREESQVGPGVQVQVTRNDNCGVYDTADVYGQRSMVTPTTMGAIGIGPVAINVPKEPIPATGWFLIGQLIAGTFLPVGGPNYYAYYNAVVPDLEGIAAYDPTYVITADTRIVLLKGPALGTLGFSADTVRGAPKRNTVLNFKATKASVGPDGSISISPVATLDDAYRANGDIPGAGRTITVDGGAIVAIPDDTAGGDSLNASVRVNTAMATNAKNEVGFDFLGTSGSPNWDPYAGYMDRRVFSWPAAGADSKFSQVFTCTLTAPDIVTITAVGDYFYTVVGVASKRSLLIPKFDLIELELDGKTYLVNGFGATPQDITICNLDFTAASIPSVASRATVYRPRFFTSRGATGNPVYNTHSWFFGHQVGGNAALEPFGALNLCAGSGTSLGLGDGGGTVASLAFWSRVPIAAGLGDEALLSTAYFDATGRYVSTLNPDYMHGSALADYTDRGDFVTRTVKGTYVGGSYSPALATAPSIAHIVEDYRYLQTRFDYLSMCPLVNPPVDIAGTVVTAATGEITTAIVYSLVPYGGAILELTSVNATPVKGGLFIIRATDNATKIWVSSLDGAHGITGVVDTDAITYRLYTFSSMGRRTVVEYQNAGSSNTNHVPSHTISVGAEVDAVGLVINAPIKGLLVGDRHAYRVTNADLGGVAVVSAKETAALDVAGYHKAQDYLYNLPLSTITKQLNVLSFYGDGIGGVPTWEFLGSPFNLWHNLTHLRSLYIPLELPRSSDRTDALLAKTHRTCLQTVVIMGEFFNNGGAPGDRALVKIHRVGRVPGTPPTLTDVSLFVDQPAFAPPCTQITYLPVVAGGDTYYVSVWEDAMQTLPVYIDDTENYLYYLEIQSNNGGGGVGDYDTVFGVQVIYTDPGPRNF
jgi:hypothetical protein